MGQFVNENTRKFPAGAIQRDAAFAQEGAAVNRAAAIPQAADSLDRHRIPTERRQTAEQRLGQPLQDWIFEAKRAGWHSSEITPISGRASAFPESVRPHSRPAPPSQVDGRTQGRI